MTEEAKKIKPSVRDMLIYYSHFAKDHFYFWAYVKINILFGLYCDYF